MNWCAYTELRKWVTTREFWQRILLPHIQNMFSTIYPPINNLQTNKIANGLSCRAQAQAQKKMNNL